MKIDFTYSFYLNKDRGNSNLRPIYLRITVDRTSIRRSTNHFIAEKDWDKEKERPKMTNSIIATALKKIENTIHQGSEFLLERDLPISAIGLMNFVDGKSQTKIFIIKHFEFYVERALQAKQFCKTRAYHFNNAKNVLEQFLKEEYKMEDYEIKHINIEFIEKFNIYLIKKGTLCHNTIMCNYHKKLKQVIEYAIKHQLVHFNPYKSFPITIKESERRFLDDEEFQKILTVNLNGNTYLENVRDLYVFCVYTGLRHSDLRTLKMIDLKDLGTEDPYISKIQDKTGVQLYVPLNPEAVKIIHKFDTAERCITKLVFPKTNNKTVNAYLKVVATIAGLTSQITFHSSRHTIAMRALNKGESLETVGKILGHKNIRTTQTYARIVNSTVKKAMLNLF